MFGFLKRKKNPNADVLRQMDGREIKYVTKRTRDEDGNVKELILGKAYWIYYPELKSVN